MENSVPGIHHITAITGDPQHNIDFYSGILGLRFVKKTVNFDVPDTYHLYYGDAIGHPGTILTFFSWPNSPRGTHGTGQVTTIAFSIPASSLAYWSERLEQKGVQVSGPVTRFDEQVLSLTDHEGLALELVAREGAELREGWADGPVPVEHAIRGFRGVTIALTSTERSAFVLTQLLGFQAVTTEGNRSRYEAGTGESAATVDLLSLPGQRRGREALGTVHHIAWRAADDEQQLAWRERLLAAGLQVTPVLDRNYFHSIYFREPGGVLYEIATDPPGFTVDESPAELGTNLKLPDWLEEHRVQLEKSLPVLHLPYETHVQ